MRKLIFIQLLVIAGFVSNLSAGEIITVHYMSPQSPKDTRQIYVKEIIKACLESTVKSDGPYKMVAATKMNWARMMTLGTQDKYPNLVIRLSGLRNELHNNWLLIPIPINRGIVGYRIFLINRSLQNTFSTISKLEDLRTKGLRAGQGRDWADVEILEENNIQVVSGSDYEGLFEMLSAQRFEYFPRGVNEAFVELADRKDKFPEMHVEETVAFYYPLPRVLATTKGNTKLADRIERGLEKIFEDGTHRKIWLKHNKQSLEKAELHNRKIFTLKNSQALPGLPYDQKKYWYQPGEEL
jgi:hypothetical protein